MSKLRNLIAAAATALTLGAATLTPASAHFHVGNGGHGGFGQFHSHFRFHERFSFRFHERFSFRFHESWRVGVHHPRWCFRWHCGPGWGWREHYHYGFRYAAPVVSAPVVAEPSVCPVGTHLGYLGKHCWPNRR